MANIKSAKKRIKVSAKKSLRNKMIKSKTKTAIKKVIVASEAGNKEGAAEALANAVKTIDKAASKGIYHKNNAARKKSRLAKLVNKISA
ncbi:30S ribosomal protein S20 [Anaeropeptidivorans aminofermentans]|uniref:30S ribosomal protein S20 n=1 Tax=Anaeropeptidivorans aminofermentans TaxID=2934315 RepID=UPI00202404A1|nr:30S ribosomal protein S20 [Anaeropeptidivorans aminofermentans]MBE6013476.1 30S ribosomal protein S20 [Lachnospiraceae bacterium]